MKKNSKIAWVVLLSAALILMAFAPLLSEVSNMGGLHLQGTFTTATPILMADQQGAGKILELRDSATPVFSVNNGGAVIYGNDNLYPLGLSTASQEIYCATTSTFTGSTAIAITGLTSVTYVLPAQVTAPLTTAVHLYASVTYPTTITLTSLNAGYSAGSTGIIARYCVVGTQ